ncbi:MAG: glycosyltransferase family 4 protein [Candidatus Nanoarchaeia archaeon]|nr:glycosyltransferase family 4 protein [Candidatus Nanoarchaeia archaeon]
MKIGFLLSSFYPSTGGREVITFNTARELAKRGHEIHVFTSLKKGLKKEETVERIHIHRSKTWFQYKYYLEFNPGWVWNAMKYRLDVLHIQSFGFILADKIVLLKKLFTKTKLVNTPHGPFMALDKYPLWQAILKKVYTTLEYPVNRLYDAVIEVNPEQWKWMAKAGARKDRIHLIPNSIPAEMFAKVDSGLLKKTYNLNGKLVISYVGRIQKYKGLDQVISILPDILKKHKNVVFLAMGKDADDMERLKKLASDLKVSEHVIFTGSVTEEEKMQGLDISKIFVFPSEWEAFGIVLVEAMARGNALISTKTEGGKYLIKEGVNGYLYDYKDTKALEKCLLKLLDDEKERNMMISNNIKKSRAFTVEKITDELEKLYKSLLK